MKKTSANNRRKKLPLLLGALLIISVAAYGTRAYFSDSATQQADIKLELGNLKIESVGSKWKYTSTDTNFNSALLAGTTEVTSNNREILLTDSQNITNVQPGDQFERIFEFKNVGSLEQFVKLDHTVLRDENSIFDVAFERDDESEDENSIIEAGDSVKYKMTISVGTDNDFNSTHNTAIDEHIDDAIFSAIGDDAKTTTIIDNFVTVTANQVNAPRN